MAVGQIDISRLAAGSADYMMYMKIPTVGASGAVFGLLLAFGMMHPNAVIMLPHTAHTDQKPNGSWSYTVP